MMSAASSLTESTPSEGVASLLCSVVPPAAASRPSTSTGSGSKHSTSTGSGSKHAQTLQEQYSIPRAASFSSASGTATDRLVALQPTSNSRSNHDGPHSYEDVPHSPQALIDVDVDSEVAYDTPRAAAARQRRKRGRSQLCGGRGCGMCGLAVATMLLAVILSAAALAFTVASRLQRPPAESTAAPTPPPEHTSTSEQQATVQTPSPSALPPGGVEHLSQLADQVEMLRQDLESSKAAIAELKERSQSLEVLVNSSTSELHHRIVELANSTPSHSVPHTGQDPTPDLLGNEGFTSALLYNLSTYQNCSTSRDTDCTVSTVGLGDPPYSVCETGSVPIKAEGLHTQDAVCVVTDRNGEGNPVVTSLDMNTDSNTMRCRCFVIALSQRTAPVSCALSVTRCPETDNYAAHINKLT